jgi:colanic acid/amylovoran biosynthesis glycosyltransferase
VRARIRRAAFRLRLSLAGSRSPYQYLADGLRWWPLGLPDRPRRDAPRAPHVGYVLWRYPALVETMIQREIEALRRAGLRVTVLAEEPEPGVTPLSPLAGEDVVYLTDGGTGTTEARLRRRPLRSAGLLLFVISRRYGPAKRLREDLRLFRAARRVASRASELGIDHLHAPWAGREAFVALVAARFAAIPYSVQARAYELHRPDAVWAMSEKIGHAKFAVTNSDFNREHLRRLIGPRAASVHRIYNGVDPDWLQPEGPQAGGQPPLLLAIGRLVPQKGFDVLLEACALLRGRGHAFRCHIVGARQYTNVNHWVALRRLHARLDLGDEVRFVGARPFSEVNDAYRDADMFVLPCVAPPGGTHDVTPNVLIEAMAMELPVVSTPIGGIPEMIDHDENGLLVPAGDASALADALERLLGDPQLRRRLGTGARDKVHARFDIRSNAERYMGLFCGNTPRYSDATQLSAASAYAGEAGP